MPERQLQDELRHALRQQGWSDEKIEAALLAVSGDNQSPRDAFPASNPIDCDTDSFVAASAEYTVPQAPSASAGKIALADYEIVAEVARGGMGIVYKARQISLNRTVALKMILAGQLADEQEVERFRSEAETAAHLEHPGIVPIYETGQQDGQHYFSMGFVEGQSLADRISDGPLPSQQAASLLRKICEAVAYAHRQGVIHRDLKPGNVLLDTLGEPRVTDFGLAKRVEKDRSLTATGQVIGTPSYMPPEQALGQAVDERSDVYSLGAILYAVLTGRPPHQAASTVDTIRSVIDREPIAPRQFDRTIPRGLETICLKAIAKESGRRYQTASELAQDLQRFLNNEPIAARRVGRVKKACLWCRRNPRSTAIGTFALLLLLIGGVAAYEWRSRTRAASLVEGLLHADADGVMAIVQQLSGYRRWSRATLLSMADTEPEDPTDRQQLHARMALVANDETYVEPLLKELLEADLPYIGPLRRSLTPYGSKVIPELWTVFRDSREPARKRFRAGVALAGWEPESEHWQEPALGEFLARQLVIANPLHQDLLFAELEGIQSRLLPTLEVIFTAEDSSQAEQIAAANAFAAFVPEQSQEIARLIVQATPDQYDILFSLIADSDAETQQKLIELVQQEPAEDLSSMERLHLGRRRAGAAITLLRQGSREAMFDALRVTNDPESLTQFVHRCRERDVTPTRLLECLDLADTRWQRLEGTARQLEDRVIYGLLLALGEFSLTEITDDQRQPLLDLLADWYANDPSSGIHGACGWLLRKWGQDAVVRRVDQTPVPYSEEREWFTLHIEAQAKGPPGNGAKTQDLYLTFVVFPPGEYVIGSPADEVDREDDEERHPVTISRPFALLDREVTAAQFEPFYPQLVQTCLQREYLSSIEQALVLPQWYDCVRYCRWLTEQRGLGERDQAYEHPQEAVRLGVTPDPDAAADGAPLDWPMRLDRIGFRLPTEAEWEIASRSGISASGAYGFGRDLSYLNGYGWIGNNRRGGVHAPAELRPSLAGLFDMHGNVLEWCHDWYGEYAEVADQDPIGPSEVSFRVYRGGGWDYVPRLSRAAYRDGASPSLRFNYAGFRLALSPSAGQAVQGPEAQ